MKNLIIPLFIFATVFTGCQDSVKEVDPTSDNLSSDSPSSAKVDQTGYKFAFAATKANNFSTYSFGGYTAHNDVWYDGRYGPDPATPQAMKGISSTSFDCPDITQTARPQYQVKSYPHSEKKLGTEKEPGIKLNLLQSCTSSAKYSFTAKAGTSFNTNNHSFNGAYDIWLDDGVKDKYEVMVWLYNYNDGPLKDDYNRPSPYTNITVGGHVWTLWRHMRTNGTFVYSFMRNQNTNSVTNLDIKALLTYLRTTAKYNGVPYLPTNTTLTLNRVEFGSEIVKSITPMTFSLKSYSVSAR